MRPAPAFGVEVDRLGDGEGTLRRLRRRLDGRYAVDPFGADPLLSDAALGALERLVVVEVGGTGTIPEIGPALLVTSARPGGGDPLVVAVAVRRCRRRRARIVGYPDLPLVGGLARRLGAVRDLAPDVGSVLRAGHLAVLGLAPTFRPRTAGTLPATLVGGAIGFPVIPVAVAGGAGSALGLAVPLGRFRVVVGEPVEVEWARARDPLTAAELAEAARDAVARLLDGL